MFTCIGDEGLRVQNLTDVEVVQEVTLKLRRAFRDLTIPDACDVYVTRWEHDPLMKGSFSFIPVQENPNALTDLIKPIQIKGQGSIWFAGEAMHK